MKKTHNMPAGFTSALMQNEAAMDFFSSCTEVQKQAIINQAKNIGSKETMQAFVDNLPGQAL